MSLPDLVDEIRRDPRRWPSARESRPPSAPRGWMRSGWSLLANPDVVKLALRGSPGSTLRSHKTKARACPCCRSSGASWVEVDGDSVRALRRGDRVPLSWMREGWTTCCFTLICTWRSKSRVVHSAKLSPVSCQPLGHALRRQSCCLVRSSASRRVCGNPSLCGMWASVPDEFQRRF